MLFLTKIIQKLDFKLLIHLSHGHDKPSISLNCHIGSTQYPRYTFTISFTKIYFKLDLTYRGKIKKKCLSSSANTARFYCFFKKTVISTHFLSHGYHQPKNVSSRKGPIFRTIIVFCGWFFLLKHLKNSSDAAYTKTEAIPPLNKVYDICNILNKRFLLTHDINIKLLVLRN